MESSTALKDAMGLSGGTLTQASIADYRLPTPAEMPQIQTYVLPSTAASARVGGPGLAPIVTALANAIFTASDVERAGQRQLCI